MLDTQMDTVSHISFVASVIMSGRTLECGGNGQTGTVTFLVSWLTQSDQSDFSIGGVYF